MGCVALVGIAATGYSQTNPQVTAKKESIPSLMSQGGQVVGYTSLQNNEVVLIQVERSLWTCIVSLKTMSDGSKGQAHYCLVLKPGRPYF